ncbi:MAG TPA: alpha-glucuronidase family glycosyl hydrolase, partial [Bacteroidota bacterium]|nr:alpha-glucuronidase family glycosyl hydrolase [Bacteroidota bacterium]
MNKILCAIAFMTCLPAWGRSTQADDGHELWLKYTLISNEHNLSEDKMLIKAAIVQGESATIETAKKEMEMGLSGLLGFTIPEINSVDRNGVILIGKYTSSPLLQKIDLKDELKKTGNEGFIIKNTVIDGKKTIIITANEDIGVLYGVFHFLRLLQTSEDISDMKIVSFPKIARRMLNHWDNLDETRVYRGISLWDWHTLPTYIKQKYVEYARANASVGINGTVLNNVNADPLIITHEYLVKVAVLADLFRPYGIKIYLSANVDSPEKLGGLKTSDPFDPQVQQWWREKVKEIYSLIPDFGGFLVKANSEGEPGPMDYARTQADGANVLAEALKPYHGIVMWRAFVYAYDPQDRAKEAYDIFHPLDGKFDDNVAVQVKNGPLDFQPREPFSPLFGAMPKTPLMMEFDIGPGALGQDIDLSYLAPMWKECLMADTYAKGKGSTVAKVIDGTVDGYKITGIAGVSNVSGDRSWTGNIFGQANWYAFGRLAWDDDLTSRGIAEEWIRMTFSNEQSIITPIENIMMETREDIVNYRDPLGLNMLGGWSVYHGPWVTNSQHADWNSPYYHRADSIGLGFDRTKTGSDAVDQYYPPVANEFASLDSCPDNELLWFHHVPWTYTMKSGKTLWDELCLHYYKGVDGVEEIQKVWNSQNGKIDSEEFHSEQMLLQLQHENAVKWRDGCVLYFQTFSHLPI